MTQLFDAAFLEKLQRLTLNYRIVLNDGALGNRKSRSKGSSVEFSDYREYTEGDDFRRVDWNAYGRFERLFVKLFMEEREAPVHIFLDTSKSMDWGEPNKSVASRRLAAALGYISLCNYDRVSLACVSDRAERVRYSFRGKNALPELLALLEGVGYDGSSDLTTAVKQVNLKAAKGVSFIISDLLFPKDNFADVVKYLQYRKQEVFVCHLLAPQEENPEMEESLRMVDSETGMYRDVAMAAQLLTSYRKVFSNYIAGLEAICDRRGIRYLRMTSDMNIEKMLQKVVGST